MAKAVSTSRRAEASEAPVGTGFRSTGGMNLAGGAAGFSTCRGDEGGGLSPLFTGGDELRLPCGDELMLPGGDIGGLGP